MPVKERGGHDLFQRLLVGTAYPDGKLELVFRITGERRDFEGYVDICSIDAHDPVSGDCGRLHFRSEDAFWRRTIGASTAIWSRPKSRRIALMMSSWDWGLAGMMPQSGQYWVPSLTKSEPGGNTQELRRRADG